MKKIIAGGGLVLNERNELLMIFRREKWDLPKGKLDANETIEQCALREVKEETGINNLDLIKFIGKTYHAYFDNWIKEDVIKESHWYLMQSSSNEKLIPQTTEDITELKWMNENEINNALKNSYPSIVEIIEKWRTK